jgi:meso-butanediol dehydrogenase/(S,S)-butanediol dehydrogenase/diacetyl reductase
MSQEAIPEVALVTGAASGIGAATARLLAERGYRVALLDVADTVHDIATELTAQGCVARAYQCDVRDQTSVDEAVSATVETWGRLNGVAACAGVEVLGDVITLSDADWNRALDINAGGIFRTIKATMPHLVAQKGAFTAVASDAGVAGAPGYSAYCASKHAVVGLVRCLALDYGPRGVRSNVVCPGFVDTAMATRIFADSPAGERSFYEQSVPLGRFAHPREVASVVAHLLSPEAGYTNGLVYNLDGGSTAGYFQAGDASPSGDGYTNPPVTAQ